LTIYKAVCGELDPTPVGTAQRLPISLHHDVLFRLGARVAVKNASSLAGL
jgi:hypothetical protein